MERYLLRAWEYILSLFLTAGTFLFGDFNGLMAALLGVIFIDLATGIAVAVANKKLSSEAGAKGFARKFLMLLVVALGHILDVYVIGGGDKIQVAATLYYILNEGVSIMENCASLGLPVPQKITEVLSQLKKGENKA
jgi:toxin secretion/phage lysis holin